MANYVIGDLQGCFVSLEHLLKRIRYSPRKDQLWFVGDIVNRGADSLACLRFVKRQRARIVLGNHDLHLLAVALAGASPGKRDTFDEILDASDAPELLDWLRRQPLLRVENEFAVVHAGLLPQWSWRLAQQLAREVERSLSSPDHRQALAQMYGNQPDRWSDRLMGAERHRFVLNVMTRMRVLDAGNRIEHRFKAELNELPAQLTPWFQIPSVRRRQRLLAVGHWSALGLHQTTNFIALDTGCVWGRSLTAVRLEDRRIFQVPSAEKEVPAGWD